MKQDYQTANIVRWAARITSLVSLAFVLIFIFGNMFGEGLSLFDFQSTIGILSFICFPVAVIVGLLIAWKWEGIGGMITMGGTLGFFILDPNSTANLFLIGLTAPGLLFLIYWFLTNGREEVRTSP
jgi:hypothetical protein